MPRGGRSGAETGKPPNAPGEARKTGGRGPSAAWWRLSLLCPTGCEDDFASVLGELTGAPVCAEPCEEGVLVWTNLPHRQGRATWRDIEVDLGRLARSLGIPTPGLQTSRVEEQEWLERWKQFFSPMVIGGKLLVRPPWTAPSVERAVKDVLIRPGLAFGTGLHATTKMCLESIVTTLEPGDAVLDVGAGSGILSIAAARLGAMIAVAVDNDPIALGECDRNRRENGVADQVLVLGGSLFAPLRGPWDIIVCNIEATSASQVARDAHGFLVPQGALILSGFTAETEQGVRHALDHGRFQLEERRCDDPWVCLTARSPG